VSTETTGTHSIEIVVNGQHRRVPQGATLSELLTFLQIDPERVAVELNRSIVPRPDWAHATVDPGAALEIVQFVGGG